MFAKRLGLDARFKPAVVAYWERLQARDGFRRAVAAEQRAGEEQGVPRLV
jgi:hypothetical protein